MKNNTLAQLESNEAILLMYQADELPPADRSEVEHMLEHDGGLRAQLGQIKELDCAVQNRLAVMTNDIDLNRVVRQTQTTMRQVLTNPSLSAIPKTEPTRLLLPWWAYPITAAASVLLAVAVFLANITPPTLVPPANPAAFVFDDLTATDVAIDYPMPREQAVALADDIVASFDDSDHMIVNATFTHGLIAASSELDAIRESSVAFDRLAIQ